MEKISFLDLGAQQKKIKKKLTHNVNNILKNSNYIMGREVKELEGKLQNYTKAKFCITCASGTDALILALLALKIGRGDKVICPSFTFPATAEAILIVGAEPLFIDVSKDTFNICYLELEKALEEKNNKIKAIISVDLFGLPANYKRLKKIARRYNVHIVSDAAQSFGASFYDKKVGAISDITCTSFFPAKPLGCYGDGGAIFTKSKTMKNKLESLRAHGKGKTKYKITDIGLNSRLDTIQAAILLAKMDVFDWELNKRNSIASQYTNELKNYFDVPIIPKNTVSAWAQFTLKSNNRKKTLIFLKEKAIPTMIYYPIPMHMQPAYSIYNNKKFKLTNSISLAKTVFSIPIHPYLSNSQKEYIIESLKESKKYG